MHVMLAEKVWIDAVTFCVRTCPRESGSHRFLHHLAEMAGHRELLSAAHPGCFNEDDVAAYGRPHQPDGNARLLDALLDFLFRAELRHAEELPHDFGSHYHFLGVAFGNLARLFANDGCDLALQV